MHTCVCVKQYRESNDGTDLIVSIPGMKLGAFSRERKSKMQKCGLMMAGIYLQNNGRKHMRQSVILQIGQVTRRKR